MDITPIVAVVAIIVVVLAFLAYGVLSKRPLSPSLADLHDQAAGFGVLVAETLKKTGVFDAYQDDLTRYISEIEIKAQNAAEDWLKQRGLECDFEYLKVSIRAAYQVMKQKQ